MTQFKKHPVNRTLNVIPASIKDRDGNGWEPRSSTILKDYSRDGTIFRKLLRASCFLKDPVQDAVYPAYKRKHNHHKGSTCTDKDLMPKLPICCPKGKTETESSIDHRNYVVFSPRPKGPDPMKSKYPDRLERHIQKSMRDNAQHQFPLPTVLLRWHASPVHGNIGYNDSQLFNVMKSYGPVCSVTRIGPESAVAIFENLTDACRLLEQPLIHYWYGPQQFHLCCSWYHRSMEARAFYKSSGGKLKTLVNDYILV